MRSAPGPASVQTVRPSRSSQETTNSATPPSTRSRRCASSLRSLRGLVQRRDVGDDAVDVDDPVGAQAVREDALPDPAHDAVVAAQPVLELERVQQALVGVAEDLVVALAIVGVDRGEPVVVVAARAVRGQPQQRARWRQRDERHETVVGMRLAAVDVQAERIDDGVQSPFGGTLRLTAPWGRFHGVPYRQEKACPEAFVRAIRTHTSCPRNRDRGRRRQHVLERGGDGRRAARRQAQLEAARTDADPPAQPRAREPVPPGQRDQVLGPERGLESVASGRQRDRPRRADRPPGSARDRARRRSSAAGAGTRGRAVAGRPAPAAPSRTPGPRCRGRPARAGDREPRRRAPSDGIEPSVRASSPMRSTGGEPGDVARLDVGRVTLDEGLRRELARRGRAGAERRRAREIPKCSSCSACVTSCAITERGAAPPEPSTYSRPVWGT